MKERVGDGKLRIISMTVSGISDRWFRKYNSKEYSQCVQKPSAMA